MIEEMPIQRKGISLALDKMCPLIELHGLELPSCFEQWNTAESMYVEKHQSTVEH